MKLAIMQPYFLPYIGYYQLIHAVDKFVIFDDVNFINRGWINRNYILVNGERTLFTMPLKEASQNKLINEINIVSDQKWKQKFLKTIEMAYAKAPFKKNIFPLLSEIVFNSESNCSKFILQSIKKIISYLKISTEVIPSSAIYKNTEMKGKQRILDICIKEGAKYYINPIGGKELYQKDHFERKGINMAFLKPEIIEYQQFNSNFVPWLSIIDVLMFNSTEKVKELLNEYMLI